MKTFFKYKDKLLFLILILFASGVLMVSLRGLPGNPTSPELNLKAWKENGPFELSPERGRFALIYSIVEDKSFYFSKSIAGFASPDVGIQNGHYVSLFAPLLSFIAIPGYLIGKYFGASQVGTFAVISLFALFNFFLIRAIAIRLGANKIAATLGAFVFLFATPGFAYAVNLYQHHLSTFLILLSIWALLKSKKVWVLILTFFLCALSIPLDYPNLILMFPIGIYALGRIVSFNKIKNAISVKISLFKTLTLLVMIIPILFFLWFNKVSYGSPLQLSGTVQTANFKPDTLEAKVPLQKVTNNDTEINKRSALAFFDSRAILNGFYIQFISPDRGIIYYTPVIILGILGAALAFRKKLKMATLFIAIISLNILLYSMWKDPWGGWAFGERYLIPSFAILSISIAILLTYWQKKVWFLLFFIFLFSYSVAVNTLGAITTSAMPPQVEVLALEKLSGTIQRYTYQRNWEVLIAGNSKSFVFQTFAKTYVTSEEYFEILAGLIILAGLSMTTVLWFQKGIRNE